LPNLLAIFAEPQPILCKDNPKNALHKAKRQKTSLSA
jgi:hypothetical protein